MNKTIKSIISVLIIITTLMTGTVQAFAKEIKVLDEDGEIRYEDFVDGPITDLEIGKYSETSATIIWDFLNYAGTMGFEILLDKGAKGEFVHYAFNDNPKYNENYKYTYKIKNLEPATTYRVKLRYYQKLYGQRYFGSTSKALEFATCPEKTKLKSVKYLKKGKVKLTWKKSKGASGYLITFSTKKNFDSKYTNIEFEEKNTNHTTVTALAKGKYYFRVYPYRVANKNIGYDGAGSNVKAINVKKGFTLKETINHYKTDMSGRKAIKSMTDGDVDIKKYKTTYARMKAIYNWHAKHYKDFKSCYFCNSSFNECIAELFGHCRGYDDFIYLGGGMVKNRDGSKVDHIWSELFFAGRRYIFDPRLQGYTGNYTGNTYFGVPYGSKTAKQKYIFQYWAGNWR